MKTLIRIFIVSAVLLMISCDGKQKKDNDGTDDRPTKDSVNTDNESLRAEIDVVMDILTTSPAFVEMTKGLEKAVVKNGGTGYGIAIEESPNPERDGAMIVSDIYRFSLHESYADRKVTVARFEFDPKKKQLYEYNVAEDKLIPMEFDKDLLSEL